MDWEYISVNLDPYVGHYIKVKFLYVYNYGGSGFGWMIDDVMVKVTSDVGNVNKANTQDNWDLISTTDKTGADTHAWYAGNGLLGGDLKNGIDDSLYTRPIDLTNARSAYLYAEFKFNIQVASGRPPDGFRVEVSTDNGVSWVPLSLGVRSSWDVSGKDNDASDGVPGDGRSFTGLPLGTYWVASDSLARLITNLEGFIGNTVILRIRVVTNVDNQHFENPALFKGLFVDNLIVYGESLEGSRSAALDVPTTSEASVGQPISLPSSSIGDGSGEAAIEPMTSGPQKTAAKEAGLELPIMIMLIALAVMLGALISSMVRRK
jgi:hypothetical protein